MWKVCVQRECFVLMFNTTSMVTVFMRRARAPLIQQHGLKCSCMFGVPDKSLTPPWLS